MADKYKGEQVLVCPRSILDEIGSFDGATAEVDRYLDKLLDKTNNRYALRYVAEEDESLKQLIPYVVFYHDGQVFSYVRGKGAGESRLRGNRSIGIGGHINPQDESLFAAGDSSSDLSTYMEAVAREIDEEVVVTNPVEPKIIGLINDDSNPVGRVHLGIVHLCALNGQDVRKKEQQITEAGFIPLDDLLGSRREELETWSALAGDLILKLNL